MRSLQAEAGGRGLRLGPDRLQWIRDVLRTNAFFLAILALGIALRVVVVVAYRPALIFTDSLVYLNQAKELHLQPVRPAGYAFFLWPFLQFTRPTGQATGADVLTAIQLSQHVIGVGLAIACYVLLRRRGLPGWGAALAMAPLLLDPLELVLEHYVLTDVLFATLLVLACLFVGWDHRPGTVAFALAGVCVGMAGIVRGAGTLTVAAFLVAAICLRVGWARLTALLVAALLPFGAYAVAYHHQHGQYAITTAAPRFLYARLAPIVDCGDPGLALPSHERILCPHQPVGSRPDSNSYMWPKGRGPAFRVVPPPGKTRTEVLQDFDRRVIRSQPLTYGETVLTEVADGFAPSRTYEVPGYPAKFWLFADHYWSWSFRGKQPEIVKQASYDPGAARFMTTYRRWVYLPGPLAFALLAVAVVAVLGVGRARACGDRVLIGLLAGTCLVTLLTSASLAGFSWRYQLPQISLLPMAGALGLAALVRGRAPGQPTPPARMSVLDRATDLLRRAPMPASWRSAVEQAAARGRAQGAVALLVGALAGVVCAAVAVGSGWFRPGSAAVVGAALGGLVALTLLVSRRRASSHAVTVDGGGSGA